MSWADAFTDLQRGIDEGILTGNAVLVAEGTYRPTTAKFPPANADSRARAFVIRGVGPRAELHGGFLGIAGGPNASTHPDKPDGSFRRTILHGGPAFAGVSSKWHVLVIDTDHSDPVVPSSQSLPGTITVDGFTITGGRAFATTIFDPLVASQGAGVFVSTVGDSRAILFENLILKDNLSKGAGGGMFLANSSVGFGSLGAGYLRVRHCRFLSNSATRGGGIALSGGLVVANTKFRENGDVSPHGPIGAQVRTEEGGAIWMSRESRIEAANLLIVSNEAEKGGATFYRPPAGNDPVLTTNNWVNCTIADNRCLATFPNSCLGGVVIEGGGSSPDTPSGGMHRVSYENCIMWGNDGADLAYIPVNDSGPLLHVDYCDVGISALEYPTGTLNLDYDPLGNNLSVDPVFEDPVAGNYKLNYELNYPLKTSPCIDAGLNLARGLDFADLDDDGITMNNELLEFDYRLVDLLRAPSIPGHPRVVNVATPNAPAFGEDIDMGAFERDSGVSEIQ